MTRTTQLIGQEVLEGMAPPQPERDLNSRNAFARAATPEYWGLNEADYQDVTGIMISAAAPEKFRADLIAVGRKVPFSVSYTDEQTGRYRNVPLLPEEYTLIPRTMSVRRYGEVPVARTLAGKSSMLRSAEDLRDRAEQHSIEAIQAKFVSVDTYLRETLQPGKDRIERLLEAATNPGFWRMREGDMRMSMEQVRTFMIPDVLRVIGTARNWTDSQAKMAAKAVDYRLFFDRRRNRHIANWRGMLGLLQEYQQEKINLFGDRRGRLEGYLHQHRVK